MMESPEEIRARNRFMVINLIRTMGVGMVLLGILISSGKIDLPVEAGYVLLAIGVVDIFLVPQLLAKRWSTRNQ
jgi:hypothetical protein